LFSISSKKLQGHNKVQESLANANVSARQQGVLKAPYIAKKSAANQRYEISYW